MKKLFLYLFIIFTLTGCRNIQPIARDFESNLFGLQEGEYTELHFDLSYPESIQIDGIRDGKVYFQYLDSSEIYTGLERDNFTHNTPLNAAGIYDIESGFYQSGLYVEDDLSQEKIQEILQSYKNHLIMENDIGYFTSALGSEIFPEEYHLYTYTVDYKNHTRKIKTDYGNYSYAAPYPLAYDKNHFFIYFEDENRGKATIYRYDTNSDEATPVIVQPEDVSFLTAMVKKESIWVYVIDRNHKNEQKRPTHFLYQYQLDGTLQKKYPLPEEIENDRDSSTDIFIPNTMDIFSGNIFYIEDFGKLNYYFLKLKKGIFQPMDSVSLDKRLDKLPQTSNLQAQNHYFFYVR